MESYRKNRSENSRENRTNELIQPSRQDAGVEKHENSKKLKTAQHNQH